MNILIVSDVEQIGNQVANNYILERNYPNPFNPSTTIRYSIAERADFELKVYDALGTLVETLVNRAQEAGVYQIVFNPVNLVSGIYFCQIKTNSFVETKKLVLLKKNRTKMIFFYYMCIQVCVHFLSYLQLKGNLLLPHLSYLCKIYH